MEEGGGEAGNGGEGDDEDMAAWSGCGALYDAFWRLLCCGGRADNARGPWIAGTLALIFCSVLLAVGTLAIFVVGEQLNGIGPNDEP